MSSYWNTAESLMLGEEATDNVEGPVIKTEDVQKEDLSEDEDLDPPPSESLADPSEGENNTERSTPQPRQPHSGSGGSGRRGGKSKRGRRGYLPPAIAEGLARHAAVQQKAYKMKYRQMQSFAESLVLENAALCDEVAEIQQKIIIANEERRFLLNKLRSFQQQAANKDLNNADHQGISTAEGAEQGGEKESSRGENGGGSKRSRSGQSGRSSSSSRSHKAKRLCPPITLDSAGRPIFPISLGPLTIHSLGEIISEKANYHRPHVIYPVGFCSSRTYASVTDPTQAATYTCKILEAGSSPRFEIVCEDPNNGQERVFNCASPTECHNQVIAAINCAPKMPPGILVTRPDTGTILDRGLRFFGLSHPSVQNVLQACPGARKCHNYLWIKFEVCRSEAEVENVLQAEREAGLCHETLLRNIMFATHSM